MVESHSILFSRKSIPKWLTWGRDCWLDTTGRRVISERSGSLDDIWILSELWSCWKTNPILLNTRNSGRIPADIDIKISCSILNLSIVCKLKTQIYEGSVDSVTARSWLSRSGPWQGPRIFIGTFINPNIIQHQHKRHIEVPDELSARALKHLGPDKGPGSSFEYS